MKFALMLALTILSLAFFTACQEEKKQEGPCECLVKVVEPGKFRLSYPCAPDPNDVWAGCLFAVAPDGEFVHLHTGEMILTDIKGVLLNGEARVNTEHAYYELANLRHMLVPEKVVQFRVEPNLLVIYSERGATDVMTCEEDASNPGCVSDFITVQEGVKVAIRDNGVVFCVDDGIGDATGIPSGDASSFLPDDYPDCNEKGGDGGCNISSSPSADVALIPLFCILMVFWIRRRRASS